jgi:DNA primase
MDLVEQIKSQVDIVRTIGEYLPLKKASASRYQGLCPFHTEKTPSFSVWVEIQAYKCYGCGKAGDLFNFIQEIEGVTFYEALKMLADRNGIEMPKRAEYSDPATKFRAALFQMHEIAAALFSTGLRGTAAQPARDYLAGRGLTPAQVEEFGIGLSDLNGQVLTRRFQQEGFPPDQLEASGLVRRRDDGSFYDAFRGRVMFPIHDEGGRIVAFAGRALQADEQPKYINSQSTKIYEKKRVLYNLNRAKKAIRQSDRSILVEGYMDVIGVYAAEVHEVVASCGTALTNEQVRSLKRQSNRIVVNFDPDTAGSNAAERSIHMLLEEGMHIRILELDGDLDPDEYIKQHGAEVYRARVEHAASYFGWLADRTRKRFDMKTAEGRMQGFQFLLPAIQRVHDRLERLTIANEVASYLGVDAGSVLDQFRRAAADRKAVPPPSKQPDIPAPERLLLRILIRNTGARDEALPRLAETGAIGKLTTRRIVEAIVSAAKPGADLLFSDLDGRLDEANKNLLHMLAFADDSDEEALTLENALHCIEKIDPADRELRRLELRSQIKSAEREGRLEQALELMKELSRIERNGN